MESKPFKANYHTHTPRCKHATGSEQEYAEAAVQAGFTWLGFADHAPWPYKSDYVSNIRMFPDELSDYCAAVKAVRDEYAGRLDVRLGLEVEYFPDYLPWQLEMKEKLGIEYWLLGAHHYPSDEVAPNIGYRPPDAAAIRRYGKSSCEAMQTGYFLYFAHPDLYLRLAKWDAETRAVARDLIACAESCRLPLEFNLGNYARQQDSPDEQLGCPCPQFWELAAQEGACCLLGVDAHSPRALLDQPLWDKAMAFLTGLGLCPINDQDLLKNHA